MHMQTTPFQDGSYGKGVHILSSLYNEGFWGSRVMSHNNSLVRITLVHDECSNVLNCKILMANAQRDMTEILKTRRGNSMDGCDDSVAPTIKTLRAQAINKCKFIHNTIQVRVYPTTMHVVFQCTLVTMHVPLTRVTQREWDCLL